MRISEGHIIRATLYIKVNCRFFFLQTSSVECAMVKSESSGKDVELVPNTEAIIEDFKIIGAGIVETIETKTEKWKI